MTPAAIIAQADADGVTLVLTQTGTIKVSGAPVIIDRWLPIIRQHKPALLAHLRRKPEPQDIIADPSDLCSKCGTAQYWQLPGKPWHCRTCAPLTADNARRATTLSLANHAPLTRPVRDSERVDGLIAATCRGLAITPQQLRAELVDDLADIESGELSPDGLRLVAETLAASLPRPQTEAERMLTENPKTQYAITSDDESVPDAVILTLALRGRAACQLRIRRDSYDGLRALEILTQQHDAPGPSH